MSAPLDARVLHIGAAVAMAVAVAGLVTSVRTELPVRRPSPVEARS